MICGISFLYKCTVFGMLFSHVLYNIINKSISEFRTQRCLLKKDCF